MARSTTKELTSGSPMKLILGFAVPLLFGMLFQQFYSLMDTIIVGRYLGVTALAAVGATGSINFLIIGFCQGICNGFGLPVAQRFGARDYDGVRKYVGNSAILSVLIGGVLTALTVIFCRQILVLMQTPSDIIDLSYNYIVVIFAGIPAIILYNILSSYLRSLGDSITPVIFLIVAAVLNIGLDLFFIICLHWGVFGAAFATVLSQAVSGVLCLFVIIRKFDILHLKRSDWVLDASYVRNLLIMGLPMGLQYSITAIGSVILQTAVIHKFLCKTLWTNTNCHYIFSPENAHHSPGSCHCIYFAFFLCRNEHPVLTNSLKRIYICFCYINFFELHYNILLKIHSSII